MPKYKNDNGETYYAYNIPEEKKKLITKEFADEFIRQLILVFSTPDSQSQADWFKESGAHITGTRGWGIALNKTAESLGCPELYEYYNQLEWYNSDEFDDKLYDLVCERSTKD